jgi:hypothetical protein
MRVMMGILVACSLSIISVWAAHLLGARLGEEAHQVALDEGSPLRIGWMLAIVIMAALGMVIAGYLGALFATGREMTVGGGATTILVLGGAAMMFLWPLPEDEAILFPVWYRGLLVLLPTPFVLLGSYFRTMQTEPGGAGAAM